MENRPKSHKINASTVCLMARTKRLVEIILYQIDVERGRRTTVPV
jgi:hypothetical protein